MAGRLLVGWAAVLAWSLCLSLTFGSTATALTPSTASTAAVKPKADLGRSVTGLKTVPHKNVSLSGATRHTAVPTRTAWPAAKTGTLKLAAPKHSTTTGSKAVAAGTPVWAQAVAPGKGTYAGPTALGVSVKSRSLSARLGVSGPVWSLATGQTAGAGASASGRVKVGLDYGAFRQAVGGNYASRLRLVELPECALTTPQLAKCRKQTPLTSRNDLKNTAVSADVTLAGTGSVKNAAVTGTGRTRDGAAVSAVYTGSASGTATARTASTSGAATVIAATDSTGQEGGAGGNYASPLSSAGSWGQSGSSGNFTYTYKVESPAASTSLAPDASLSYDSGSVDGKTANTQCVVAKG
ncbi:hypothetical protein JHN45_51145, partial [Streptomyces sp. MBT53]|nr:hypothetical protein [Streptomyces sp. MBT53]